MNSTLVSAPSAKWNPLKVIDNVTQIAARSWLLIPALLFYQQVWQHAINIPILDDYDVPLDFVMRFSKLDLWGKLVMLFAQHGEHRLVPSKLIYLAYYYLTGEINFRAIGIIGDLQLLVVAFVGLHFIKKLMPSSWKIPAIIWMLVVFDLNTYENACMCMNAVGNYGVCCYFFAAIYFYTKSDKWIPIAVLFQFLCIFSNANGLAAGILIALFNIVRSRQKMLISLTSSGIFIGLYFINYHSVTLPTKVPFDFNTLVTFFIRQSGAHFSFDNSLPLGLLVLGLLAYFIPWRRLLDPKLTPLLCIFLFAIGTMGLAAIYRSNTSDAQFQTSRYLIYPQMMIACLCLFIWLKIASSNKKRIGGAVILGLMLLTYGGNYRFGKLGFERTAYRAETRKFWHPDPASCEKITKQACQEGIYCIADFR